MTNDKWKTINGKCTAPFCLVVTRYVIGGGKRGNVGGTHGEAVPHPFAPRGHHRITLLLRRVRSSHEKKCAPGMMPNNPKNLTSICLANNNAAELGWRRRLVFGAGDLKIRRSTLQARLSEVRTDPPISEVCNDPIGLSRGPDRT